MKVIILSALAQETEFLDTKFEILFTGVGKINATYATVKALKEKKPDLIVNFGTAGSLRKDISGLIDCKYFVAEIEAIRPLSNVKSIVP